MRIQSLVIVAAVAVLFTGWQPVAAQQMSPYAMGGYPAAPMGYQGAAPMGYMSPYAPVGPPNFNVRQEPAAEPAPVSQADCNACGQAECNCCVCDCWGHRVAVFGEFMYIRARNAEVAYGVPIDGPIIGGGPVYPVQVGRVGVVDQDFEPAFRFGFSFVLDGWSSLSLQYTRLETSASDQIATAAPDVIRSLVSHPGTFTASRDHLSAQASHDIKYDLIDADYRSVLNCEDNQELSFLVGVRYAQLSQNFAAMFAATGTETVQTDVDFNGAGLRLGLEGERTSRSGRLLVYGKTAASLVAGEFTADYSQVQTYAPEVVNTTWKAGRIVPILDLELGAGWQSRCGTWRVTGGYMYNSWGNCVKTDRWVKAVQSNNFVGLSDWTTFDGFICRVEGRF